MKIKLILALLFSIILATAANAQTDTTVIDSIPDDELLSILENLKNPVEKDTTTDQLTINVLGDNINMELYSIGRNLENASGFSGKEARILRKIIALTPAQRKIPDLILSMTNHANFLSKKTFNFNNGLPGQTKIAYSWGSKHFEERRNPPGEGDLCTYEVHGLDCSGFIYQLFYRSGVNLPWTRCNADNERKPLFLTPYLTTYFGSSDFEVKDMGQLKAKEMQSGDLIYFRNKTGAVVHIAIVLLNESGRATLFQSIGNPNRSSSNSIWCEKNIDNDHGVIAKILDSSIENGRPYGCVRILAK